MTSLAIPEIGKTAATVVDDAIFFVTVDYDDSPEDPTKDMDGVGDIYSFNQRDRSFNREAIEEALKNPDHVMLSYFEHGQCRWDVAGGGLEHTPDFEWDGSANAGVWVPDNAIVESVKMLDLEGEARSKWIVLQAQSACELFTDYCNGQVFYYSIKAFRTLYAPELAANPEKHSAVLDLLSDYRHSKPLYEDACGGYYGYSDFETEFKSVSEFAVNHIKPFVKEVGEKTL